MQRHHLRSLGLVALFFVALGSASCGDDDDSAATTTSTSTTAISIAGAGSRFRPTAEYDGDTIRFLTTVDNCDQVAVYQWQVDGDTLVLTPVGEDPCANRRFFLGAGTFTREGEASTTTTG